MSAGQTIILGRTRETAHRIVDVAPAGHVLTVKPPTRSSDQNAKMHAMLSDIARAKPGDRVLTPDQWKCVFMDALARETKNAAFTARWEPGLDGEGVVNLGYRSSRLNKAEMGELLTFIQAWGDQKGIEWSQ